jgi:hypothetical protein
MLNTGTLHLRTSAQRAGALPYLIVRFYGSWTDIARLPAQRASGVALAERWDRITVAEMCEQTAICGPSGIPAHGDEVNAGPPTPRQP